MARLPRLVLPGVPHHVTQRGNRREKTFFDELMLFSKLAPNGRAYGTNALNQLTSAGATALIYDGRGILTGSGATAYSYTAANRMVTSARPNEPGATLLYDMIGRLWQVTKGAGVTRFDYSGTELIAETDGRGVILRRYVHGTSDDVPPRYGESCNNLL
jgi:hypothetical protein